MFYLTKHPSISVWEVDSWEQFESGIKPESWKSECSVNGQTKAEVIQQNTTTDAQTNETTAIPSQRTSTTTTSTSTEPETECGEADSNNNVDGTIKFWELPIPFIFEPSASAVFREKIHKGIKKIE